MSLSPTSSLQNISDNSSKRRRMSTATMQSPTDGSGNPNQPMVHVPKRGARACTACRKGKNRCEGEAPCRRCQLSGTPCVFEKPEKKNVSPLSGGSVERLSRLEGQYLVMQSQMIGMQSSLDRILSAVQTQSQLNAGMPPQPPMYPPNMGPGPNRDVQGYEPGMMNHRNGFDMGPGGPEDQSRQSPRYPPLPGYPPPPPHKYGNYGIVPGGEGSSEDESEDALSRNNMSAPIEALQGLANAAAEAAAVNSESAPRAKKRKRAEPAPRNAFPHVVEKGLVSDTEARELYHIFFAGCHLFIPLFDPTYDTYESLMERTPWTFDAILAIAAKIRSGNGPLSATFYKCLEEAQGIARSSLFGPVAKKEAVQGMLLLAAWSTNGWLPGGHAMRMALDLGLHRALERLADEKSKQRTQEEDRDLVVSARIWLCLYWFDHHMSLSTGRPIVFRDENSIKHCRILLGHPMASPTDVRLVSQVELIAQKTQIYETLTPPDGQVHQNNVAFIRRAIIGLDKWWEECDEFHRRTMDEDSLLRKILAGELHYAKLWLISVALRGVSWDKIPFDQRELAFQAKDAASNCLAVFLTSTAYRAALRYAVHDSLVAAAFSGLFLLKMASLFPAELDLNAITSQVEQLAQLLSDVAAERHAGTLRFMLGNLRRKLGMQDGENLGGPNMPHPYGEGMLPPPSFVEPSLLGPEELSAAWSGGMYPAPIPPWLQEQNMSDLGLPMNGSDGIFLPIHGPHGWTGDFPPMPEAW